MARILVADDSVSIRALVAAALAFDGHAVVEVGDGTSALERLTTEQFEVAVLDVMMPGVDGLTLCRRLRDAPGLGHLAVIVLSAAASEVAALAAGADAFFTKPFSPTSLRKTVARLAGADQPAGRVQRLP